MLLKSVACIRRCRGPQTRRWSPLQASSCCRKGDPFGPARGGGACIQCKIGQAGLGREETAGGLRLASARPLGTHGQRKGICHRIDPQIRSPFGGDGLRATRGARIVIMARILCVSLEKAPAQAVCSLHGRAPWCRKDLDHRDRSGESLRRLCPVEVGWFVASQSGSCTHSSAPPHRARSA